MVKALNKLDDLNGNKESSIPKESPDGLFGKFIGQSIMEIQDGYKKAAESSNTANYFTNKVLSFTAMQFRQYKHNSVNKFNVTFFPPIFRTFR